MVLGEDPGLVADISTPGSQTLTLFVFLVAAGWAVWQVASGRGGFTLSPAEWTLLVVVLCTFVSAEAAVYKHPARLIAWEWLGLFVTFALVRRMPVSPSEQRGLLAALLATTVALSAQAVYQCAYEYPQMAASVGGSAERVGSALSRISLEMGTTDDRFLESIRQRLKDAFATATFAHPNSFAGYLVLFLPALVGAALVVRWNSRRHSVWLWAFAALTAGALWLSHSRGAFAAVVLVGLVVATIRWRHRLWARRGWVAAGVLALAVVGLAVLKSGLLAGLFAKESSGGMSARLEYWQTTASIIGAHPWLGVGPGNFRGAYQRYMDVGMGEQVVEPHNFVIEIWATSGLVALVALLVALGLIGLALVCRHNSLSEEPEAGRPNDAASEKRSSGAPLAHGRGSDKSTHHSPLTTHDSPAWVFFAGGAIGIALSFALRVHWQEPGIDEALSVVLRLVAWLSAMAVLIHVPWSSGTCIVVLAAGAAALLLNLLVSGGIAFFSVATPLWAVLALSLNLVSPALDKRPSGATRLIPLLFLPLAVLYALAIYFPLTSAFGQASEASRLLADYRAGGRRQLHWRFSPYQQIEKNVVAPLRAAVATDPGYARLHVLLAEGTMELAKLAAAAKDTKTVNKLTEEAFRHSLRAQELCPEDTNLYFARARHWLERANLASGTEAATLTLNAAAEINRAIPYDPTEARLHLQLADLLFMGASKLDEAAKKEPEPERLEELRRRAKEATALALQAAEEALRLDEAITWAGRKLSNPERVRLDRWLTAKKRE